MMTNNERGAESASPNGENRAAEDNGTTAAPSTGTEVTSQTEPLAAETAPAAEPAKTETSTAETAADGAAPMTASPEAGTSPAASAEAPATSAADAADPATAVSNEAEPEEPAPDLKTGKPELPSDEMSFAEMFELAEKQSQEKRKKLKAAIGGDLRPGQIIFAKVVGESGDSVFVDVGAKAEGVIPKSELVEDGQPMEVKEGDKIEARIRKIEAGSIVLTKVPAHQSLKKREELKEAHRASFPVEGKVTGTNKGGFDVEIAGIRVFCPSSQIDVRPLKSDFYVGKKFPFRIVEFKDGGRNIVVSRRVILDEENKKKAEALLAELNEGDVRKGKISSLKDYGAFIDLGGLEGLVHLTEISHAHVTKPHMVLKLGDEVDVKVLKIEDAKDGQKKISLSMKALEQDPWEKAGDELKEGQKIRGKIARIQSFGAFVEILPGVDGLVHVSNMSLDRRLKNPRDVVKEGDEVEATVVSIDWNKRRIGLSMVKTPQELANELKSGSVVQGKVDRIEDFGVFVKLESGARGLVPARETGTQQGTDLKKTFNNGDPVKVLVQDVDKKSGRIRMSMRAAREAEERAEYVGYINKDPSGGKGLGTLGDLLKGKLADIQDQMKE